MSTAARHQIIDGDGHVVEDISTIWKYMPQEYVGRSFSDARGRSPFPPIDHLHSANRHFTPKGAFANVGREGWELFLEEVGIGTTVLYPSAGLALARSSAATGPSSLRAPTTTGFMIPIYRRAAALKRWADSVTGTRGGGDRTQAHCARLRL